MPFDTTHPGWLTDLTADRVVRGQVTAIMVHGTAEVLLPRIPDNSVDLVLTDPPYFIDRMGSEWHKGDLKKSQARAGVIGSLPVGMKFDPEQGRRLAAYLHPVFGMCHRILKPGGFLVSFSQARLYHRMAQAAEDAGFEIRDMLGWTYEGQAKAFSQDHFVRRMRLTPTEKQDLLARLDGRKTPQLKPMIEPMVLGQKPREGTYVDNWSRYGVGLIDTRQTWEGKFPGTLMGCRKPDAIERGTGNNHPTVKPQKVLQHLIRLLLVAGADPLAADDRFRPVLEGFERQRRHDLIAVIDETMALRAMAAARDRLLRGLVPEYARRRLPKTCAAQARAVLASSWRRPSP